MGFTKASDPDLYIYNDLVDGSGDIAARDLVRRIRMVICKKFPEFRGEADMMAVEVLERAYIQIDNFQWNCRFFTWICSIAYNRIREELREKGKAPLSEEFLSNVEAEFADPEEILLEQVTYEDKQALIDEFLQTLTEHQRTIFHLKHTAEPKMTSAQIGKKLNISAGAVRSAFRDANVALDRWRKKNGY